MTINLRNIPDDLARRAKVCAALYEKTLKQFAIEALEEKCAAMSEADWKITKIGTPEGKSYGPVFALNPVPEEVRVELQDQADLKKCRHGLLLCRTCKPQNK